jgi:hypothetical protein
MGRWQAKALIGGETESNQAGPSKQIRVASRGPTQPYIEKILKIHLRSKTSRMSASVSVPPFCKISILKTAARYTRVILV